jgi:hypothetical protein
MPSQVEQLLPGHHPIRTDGVEPNVHLRASPGR